MTFLEIPDFDEDLVDAEDEKCYEASQCSLQTICNDREKEFNDPPPSISGLSRTVKTQ